MSSMANFSSNNNFLEIKSKYDAEFRRFGLVRCQLSKFEEFYQLLERLHGLYGIQFNIYYTDKDGDLLPINNDNNFGRVQQVTAGILRLIILRKGECYPETFNSNSNFNSSNFSSLNLHSTTNGSYRATNFLTQIKELSNPFSHGSNTPSHYNNNKPFQISYPEDFRPVSAIIDVDILPDTFRRVRLHKHKSSKPLGFYIRDGRSLRVTPNGVEQVPGIFISRLMPGGLAESTGLLSVNDEVIEVNGIEVAGKTLDQVTDMMVANSSNLIITVKPTNQKYNLNKSTNMQMMNSSSQNSSLNSSNLNTMVKHYNQNTSNINKANLSNLNNKSYSLIKSENNSSTKLNNNNNNLTLSGTGVGGGSSSISSSSVNSSFSSLTKHQLNQATSEQQQQRSSFRNAGTGSGSNSNNNSQRMHNHLQAQSNIEKAMTQSIKSSSIHPRKDGSDIDYGLEQDSEDEDDDDDDDDEEIHDATGNNNTDNDDKILTL